MKKAFFTSLFFENFNLASTHLNFFKVTSLETASLNLQKNKKEFYIKIYNTLKKKQKRDIIFSTTTFQQSNLDKKELLHKTFYFASLKKKHLSFLDNVYNKKLFNKINFSNYEG